ncbi:hypothetical protein B0T20DRAFT_502140 [Sordaria brevicollis]|uniref:Uncharacterized protein n=1 Tax=Sordaria brevicollis TaxID=83679 RepID=A0AAE0UA69_SORBR|nr:hypothetical protein B0T20DRAFT_502140 [Sordaria brevicollis]
MRANTLLSLLICAVLHFNTGVQALPNSPTTTTALLMARVLIHSAHEPTFITTPSPTPSTSSSALTKKTEEGTSPGLKDHPRTPSSTFDTSARGTSHIGKREIPPVPLAGICLAGALVLGLIGYIVWKGRIMKMVFRKWRRASEKREREQAKAEAEAEAEAEVKAEAKAEA